MHFPEEYVLRNKEMRIKVAYEETIINIKNI